MSGPWRIVFAAAHRTFQRMGRRVRDYIWLKGLHRMAQLWLWVTASESQTHGVDLFGQIRTSSALAGRHVVCIIRHSTKGRIVRSGHEQVGKRGPFKDESATWTPVQAAACFGLWAAERWGWIASDAASQSDGRDSHIACFVKFSSAKLGKMNGRQFAMN